MRARLSATAVQIVDSVMMEAWAEVRAASAPAPDAVVLTGAAAEAVAAEQARPAADTPERRATFARVDAMAARLEQAPDAIGATIGAAPNPPDAMAAPMAPTSKPDADGLCSKSSTSIEAPDADGAAGVVDVTTGDVERALALYGGACVASQGNMIDGPAYRAVLDLFAAQARAAEALENEMARRRAEWDDLSRQGREQVQRLVTMNADLRARLAEAERERDGWRETAHEAQRDLLTLHEQVRAAIGADDADCYTLTCLAMYTTAMQEDRAEAERRAAAAQLELRARWNEHAEDGCAVCEPWRLDRDYVCRHWREACDVLADARAAAPDGGEGRAS